MILRDAREILSGLEDGGGDKRREECLGEACVGGPFELSSLSSIALVASLRGLDRNCQRWIQSIAAGSLLSDT